MTYSGRTEESVQKVLDSALNNSEDVDFQALLQETSNMPASTHPYRGFTLLNSQTQQSHVIEVRRLYS